ncbi:MAG TPA: RluA family pseudouridine synthase [Actinomycetota bacterium]|nr:RluA family pseudouridine synthase [Actinomycetota bacterium]
MRRPADRDEAVAGPGDAGRRLDEVVAELAGTSRSRAARWATDGLVTVDGRPRPKSYRLREGERLAWSPPPAPPEGGPVAEDRPLAVRYEDDHLLVVAKPAGLVVHPGPGHPTGTLVNALLGRQGGSLSGGGGAADRPGIVHRLDKDTSGLLLVAKDDPTHLALARDLADHRVERRYLALVQGRLPAAEGTVDAPVGRHPRDRKRMAVVPGGRPAVTHWRVLETFPAVQLAEATLETGRTHQVRVHLASLRHPLAGDRAYGADPTLAARLGLARPFLHAWRLAFDHPADGTRVELTEPLPPDLQAVLDRLHLAGP